MNARLTDSHAHLDFEDFAGDLPGVIARARAAGVERIMTISSRAGDASRVVSLAESLPETWGAIGVHPHEASAYTDAHETELRELSSHPKVLALGEMGLDYHYDHSPRDVQQAVFRRQLRLAREVALPVVIHSRESETDTIRILREERADEVGGVLHCFTSGFELAEAALSLGFLVSYSGIVTYKSAAALAEASKRIPADRLLVETDSPFLSPMPHRGAWPNEPARVRCTAEFLAALRGSSLEELAATTSANFERVFLARIARA